MPTPPYIPQLIDRIVTTHHAFVRREAAAISGQLAALAAEHGALRPDLLRLQAVFADLTTELLVHLEKEERLLFPYMRALDDAARAGADGTEASFDAAATPRDLADLLCGAREVRGRPAGPHRSRRRGAVPGGAGARAAPAGGGVMAGRRPPMHPRNPERICWGCDLYCPADDLRCGNGTIRTAHPIELLGDDWDQADADPAEPAGANRASRR